MMGNPDFSKSDVAIVALNSLLDHSAQKELKDIAEYSEADKPSFNFYLQRIVLGLTLRSLDIDPHTKERVQRAVNTATNLILALDGAIEGSNDQAEERVSRIKSKFGVPVSLHQDPMTLEAGRLTEAMLIEERNRASDFQLLNSETYLQNTTASNGIRVILTAVALAAKERGLTNFEKQVADQIDRILRIRLDLLKLPSDLRSGANYVLQIKREISGDLQDDRMSLEEAEKYALDRLEVEKESLEALLENYRPKVDSVVIPFAHAYYTISMAALEKVDGRVYSWWRRRKLQKHLAAQT